MVKLDIVEKRVFQDGCILFRVGGCEIDVWVFIMLSNVGEWVVFCLLDKQVGCFDLMYFGMVGDDFKCMIFIIIKFYGIILVIGFIGFGKIIMLYVGLMQFNDSLCNIFIVEDLIEYQLEGIGQIQVNIKVEMMFVWGLWVMLC